MKIYHACAEMEGENFSLREMQVALKVVGNILEAKIGTGKPSFSPLLRSHTILSFNINDGFEAFNVKLLENYACPECNRSTEFTSDDCKVKCPCGKEVHKPE